MEPTFLSAKQGAQRLGVSTLTLYDWLGKSDRGLLSIRGQPTTIDYLQSGQKGQGKIQIETCEIERIRELMRVHPLSLHERRPMINRKTFPGITVPLGLPIDPK